MSTSDASTTLRPNLKGVLETLRDSSILAVCLAVLFTFAGGRDLRSFLFWLAEIWIYTTIIMLLAWQIFPRIVPFIDDQSSEYSGRSSSSRQSLSAALEARLEAF